MTPSQLEAITWIELNALLLEATEDVCLELLLMERSGKKRRQYLRRIHARVNKLRGRREKKELREGEE